MKSRACCILSGAGLLLIPKCPLCLAAYLALFTGASLSVRTASHLRIALLLLCAVPFLWILIKGLRRALTT